MGVDLLESLDIVDVGDVNVIPANIEKSFDQIDKAVAYIHERAVFPVVLGGDHSIGYPDIRGLAPYVDGNIGIIHFDRHTDMSEYNLDERMHGTPFFHATNIPNAPPANLVQIGIGGWLGSRDGVQDRARARRDLDHDHRHRPLRARADRRDGAGDRLEEREGGLSLVRHRLDRPGLRAGHRHAGAGGLLPREALRMLHLVAREGLAGMEVVEVSPPYDVGDITSLLGVRVINDVLGTLVLEGKLGRRPAVSRSSRAEERAGRGPSAAGG